MPGEILNNVSTLVLPKLTQTQIESIAANAEMGSLFYDTTNNKIIFVKNAGGHEHITSA